MTGPQYPQLQPPGPGGPAPVPAYTYPVQPWTTGPGVPPVPPTGRSTGFWIATTACVAVGVIVALLAGFFIGRGTRLANSDVQTKITQQAQADQIAQQTALTAQRTTMLDRQTSLLQEARKTSLAQGKSEGKAEGKAEGEQIGSASGQSEGFTQGQSSGYNQGYNDGLQAGLNEAADECFDIEC
jgi:hypothetical protein